MKKITIIFMVVFCILFFVEIPCLATKEASSPSGMWNSMDDIAKETYIWGGQRWSFSVCGTNYREVFNSFTYKKV